jgi:hypothetical protein
MSDLLEMLAKEKFDDSHIDYGHEIWQLAEDIGIYEVLTDFVSNCYVESETEEN